MLTTAKDIMGPQSPLPERFMHHLLLLHSSGLVVSGSILLQGVVH